MCLCYMLHKHFVYSTLLEYLSGGNNAGSFILPTSTTRWKHLSRNTPPDHKRAQWSLKERTWSHRSSDSSLVKLHFILYLSLLHTFPLFDHKFLTYYNCSKSFILLDIEKYFYTSVANMECFHWLSSEWQLSAD